jgi:hypothetical protein
MTDLYIDPVMEKYAETIKSGTTVFNSVFYGDPIRIGASQLPALVIAKVDTRVSNMTNQEDMHQIRLSFTVVTDIHDTLNEDSQIVAGTNALYNIMEGRQNGTYQLDPKSLLYILRHNVEIDPANNLRTDLSTMSRVDYGMTMGKRKESAWSIEGTLEITAIFTQVR